MILNNVMRAYQAVSQSQVRNTQPDAGPDDVPSEFPDRYQSPGPDDVPPEFPDRRYDDSYSGGSDPDGSGYYNGI